MALAQEDIEQILLLIRESVSERLLAQNVNVRYELDLRERTIRVEEELKHQCELMVEGFKQMKKRFEQVDKRFQQVHGEIMAIHSEIKQLMRWRFGTLLAIASLVIAVLRLMP